MTGILCDNCAIFSIRENKTPDGERYCDECFADLESKK